MQPPLARPLLLLAATTLSICALQPGTAWAQAARPQATPAAQRTPASGGEANTYITMGAVNICTLSQRKVGLDTALGASAEMVTSVLLNKHGGVINGVNSNKALTADQLIQFSAANLVSRVNQICLKSLNATDQDKLRKLLAELQKANARPNR